MNTRIWKTYTFWILLAEVIGGLSGWLTRDSIRFYEETITQPPFSPPAIVFPIIWVILFALMGIGAARVYMTPASNKRSNSLLIFFVQLAFNFLWSIIFFNLKAYGAAFFWLLILWALIIWMIAAFSKLDRFAALIQIPYLLWVTFAAYLNLGVWLLS